MKVAKNVSIWIEWKPQDLWIGAFWKRGKLSTDIWICLVPCLPICIVIWKI